MMRQAQTLFLFTFFLLAFHLSLTSYGQGVDAVFVEDMAELGDPEAQWLLGKFYEDGNERLEKDSRMAVNWYTRSAEQGYVPAQRSLGFLYKSGVGVLQNYGEALKWFLKAAEEGDGAAQTSLGVMYEKGMGVNEDYAEALRWYRRAMEQGSVLGLMGMASIHFFGKGVPVDEVEGYAWVLLLASEGNEWGARCKEEWGLFMTSAQIVQAEERARDLYDQVFGGRF